VADVYQQTIFNAEPQQQPSRRPSARNTALSGLNLATRLLYHSDSLVYLLVGICFFVAALLSLSSGIFKFWTQLSRADLGQLLASDQAAPAIINLVSDLLLTLIIMEVLSTVVHYLRTHQTSLKPFLFTGIVSATRGILEVGARLSAAGTGTLTPDEFRYAMIELGVNAAVIIALGITLRLIGHFLDDHTGAPESGAGRLDTFTE
jgi:uncharacterized membrane protein (DUF373 family)